MSDHFVGRNWMVITHYIIFIIPVNYSYYQPTIHETIVYYFFMKISKQGQDPGIVPAGPPIHSFTYRGTTLQYPSAKPTPLSSLAAQYTQLTSQPLNLQFNCLLIPHSIVMQTLLTNQTQRELFERVINLQEDQPLTLKPQEKMHFNCIIHRIMVHQEEALPHASKIKGIKSVKSSSLDPQESIQDLMPLESSRKVVYWIDDQPQNNTHFIDNYLEPRGIQTIQVTATSTMATLLDHHWPTIAKPDRHILLVSDMTRKEGVKWNSEAGVDLFEHVYNKLGLNIRGVLFVGNHKAAQQKIIKRKVQNEHIRIAVQNIDLAHAIYEDFQQAAKKASNGKEMKNGAVQQEKQESWINE